MPEAPFSLQDQVAIVTGAVGLLGRAHCQALARAGASVVVADLDGDACQAFARELGGAAGGTRVLGHSIDVTDKRSIERLCQATLDRFGRIDVLINNAGVDDKIVSENARAPVRRFEDYPIELWQRSLDVNVTGTFLCCQRIGAVMAERRRGSIINIASTYGVVAPDPSLYRRPDGTQ